MSGKRKKLLMKEAETLGIDITTLQIGGRGIPNRLRKIKKYYIKYKCFPK